MFRREQTPGCAAGRLRGRGRDLTEAPIRRRALRPVGTRRCFKAALATHIGEKMDTTTLIVIVLVVLLLGGGGFFYRRRV